MGIFGVWCGKCAKYLAFGTFTTPAVDALKRPFYGEPKGKMSGFHENFLPKSFDIFNDYFQRLILVLTNKLLHVKAFL